MARPARLARTLARMAFQPLDASSRPPRSRARCSMSRVAEGEGRARRREGVGPPCSSPNASGRRVDSRSRRAERAAADVFSQSPGRGLVGRRRADLLRIDGRRGRSAKPTTRDAGCSLVTGEGGTVRSGVVVDYGRRGGRHRDPRVRGERHWSRSRSSRPPRARRLPRRDALAATARNTAKLPHSRLPGVRLDGEVMLARERPFAEPSELELPRRALQTSRVRTREARRASRTPRRERRCWLERLEESRSPVQRSGGGEHPHTRVGSCRRRGRASRSVQ